MTIDSHEVTLPVNGTFNVKNISFNTDGVLTANNATLSVFGNWTGSVAWNAGTSTIILKDSVAALSDSGSFYDLTVDNAEITLSGPIIVHSFNLISGTFYSGASGLNVSGDWSNSGTFDISGCSGVELTGSNQTISGNTTFCILQKIVLSDDTLTFEAGSQQSINNLTLNGDPDAQLSLRSSQNGSTWNVQFINEAQTSYLDVKDSTNTGEINFSCTTGCIDSGNNTGWDFEEVTAPIMGLPDVPVTDITTTSAKLHGYTDINGGEDPSETGFTYGIASEIYNATIASNGIDENNYFIRTITNLTCNTTYYFKAYGTNSGGTGYSSESSFTTSACAVEPEPIRRSSGGSYISIPAITPIIATSTPGCPIGYTCTPIPGYVAPTLPIFTYTLYPFTRNLTIGSLGLDVRALQVYLNTHGFILATIGPGSPGKETTFFGLLTRAALAKFQYAHNIAPAVGYFGPITRKFVETRI